MSRIRYVVTEESSWKDPDLIHRGFNVDKGTVCGIYNTKEEAFHRIDDYLNCPLYKPYSENAVWNGDYVEIHHPDILDARFDIHEHDFDSGKDCFYLKP